MKKFQFHPCKNSFKKHNRSMTACIHTVTNFPASHRNEIFIECLMKGVSGSRIKNNYIKLCSISLLVPFIFSHSRYGLCICVDSLLYAHLIGSLFHSLCLLLLCIRHIVIAMIGNECNNSSKKKIMRFSLAWLLKWELKEGLGIRVGLGYF